MLPAVTVSSTTQGRTRLKVESHLKNGEFFDKVVSELSHFPGIESLESNRLTGSILLHHSVPIETLSEYAQKRKQVFVVDAPPEKRTKAPPPRSKLKRGPSGEIHLSKEAREVLGTLGFIAFCGLGVRQLVRGQSLPAGLNLFLKGFSFLSLETTHEPEVVTID